VKTLENLRNDGLLATEVSKFESRLWRQVRRDGLKTVMITSAVRGEGKSTTLAYLATSLGLYPQRKIVVVDMDFRIPTLNRHFGLPVLTGIDLVLEGKAKLSEAIMKTELPGLSVALPSEGGADPALLHRTRELEAMLQELAASFDLVLVDTPAIIPVADPTILVPYSDGVILAAMAGKTTEPQLTRAQEICEGLDANILGVIVSNVEEAAPDYISDDYNYGYRERPETGSNGSPEATPSRKSSGRR
jgi:capsular exopolysaccharide synthesis family protein